MLRSLPHGRLQPGLQLVPLALQEEPGLLGLLPVGLLVHGGDAGRRAAVELELHAGPASLAIDVDVAVPELEEPVDQLCGAVGRGGREEGPEVEGAVLLDLPGHEHLGEGVLPGELHIGIGLVVPEQDVEGGEVLLDEVVLQDQGFQLRLADDELQVPDTAHQAAGLGIQVLVLEVALDPVAQDLGLAHVEQVAFLVPVEVDPRPGGQVPQLPLQGGTAVEVGTPEGHDPSLVCWPRKTGAKGPLGLHAGLGPGAAALQPPGCPLRPSLAGLACQPGVTPWKHRHQSRMERVHGQNQTEASGGRAGRGARRSIRRRAHRNG